jgi:hypothetical protein
MKHKGDPGIAWIREIRHKISAEFDHDPKKLGEHYRELEKKYADRLVQDFREEVAEHIEIAK